MLQPPVDEPLLLPLDDEDDDDVVEAPLLLEEEPLLLALVEAEEDDEVLLLPVEDALPVEPLPVVLAADEEVDVEAVVVAFAPHAARSAQQTATGIRKGFTRPACHNPGKITVS